MIQGTDENASSATPVEAIVRLPFEPFYDQDGITIYNADCRKVLPWLEPVDLLLTDPPYGIGADNRKKILSRANMAAAKDYGETDWDREPPPRWFLDSAQASATTQILWGGNYYGLPASSCWLVWDKDNTGDFADCELAWTNMARAVRKFKWRWNGMLQEHGGDKKEHRVHPTQKPLALMRWCLSLVPEAQTVLDPFMGSGTTLLAAKLEGRKAVGIEINRTYCEAAVNRLKQKTLW
jgi:DNA modification methylase